MFKDGMDCRTRPSNSKIRATGDKTPRLALPFFFSSLPLFQASQTERRGDRSRSDTTNN